ncbi:amidohydrolase family protein [Candidatus Lokiarchaeum ossiferum]|uniref:amidohydrolase family protein n=1 Tax=Candidatus Lokiarchaeum ossiferum TaxID=2951803 RepID=UPI00352DF5AC
MLRVKTEIDGKIEILDMIVIDAHSHLGIDEDGTAMQNPLAPGQGTFDFWGKIENMIRSDWNEGKMLQSYNTRINSIPTNLSFEFIQLPLFSKITKALKNSTLQSNYSGLADRFQYQNLIDQGVVFPFQDVFRKKKPAAIFRASNINVARHVSQFPVSLRLNGYIRCVPWEGQKALDEVDFWMNQTANIRGIKLHPRSDGWLDSVSSSQVIEVVKKAAFYNLPVIFDTRGKQTIMDLAELIKKTRDNLRRQSPELIPQFKAIIAHAAAGNVNDEDVYAAIAQPNTYMDMSLCQGKTVEQFFLTFRLWCERNQIAQKTGRTWSEFCLYASDYPYFQELHAKSLIQNLIDPIFFENGGNLQDLRNILGLNQLKLFPEYGKSIKFPPTVPISLMVESTQKSVPNASKDPNLGFNTQDIMYQSIAKLIEENQINIKKVIFQFEETWKSYKNEAILYTSPKKNPENIIPLMLMNIQDDNLGLITTIPDQFDWNPLGSKFYDASTNKIFRKIISRSNTSNNAVHAKDLLSHIYT